MTPRMIAIMMHYYVHQNDEKDYVPDHNNKTQQIEDAIADLISASLVRDIKMDGTTGCYIITDKGIAYCQYLLKVPMPEQVKVWVIKNPNK